MQQQHITDKDIILKWVHQFFLCSISHAWTDTDIILIAGAKEAEALYWEVLKCPRQSRTSPDLAHLINVEVEVNAKKVHLYDALMLIFKSTSLPSHCRASCHLNAQPRRSNTLSNCLIDHHLRVQFSAYTLILNSNHLSIILSILPAFEEPHRRPQIWLIWSTRGRRWMPLCFETLVLVFGVFF